MSWEPWTKTYHLTVTIDRPESRAERRRRERMARMDKFMTGLFVFAAAAILVLITVALCHAV